MANEKFSKEVWQSLKLLYNKGLSYCFVDVIEKNRNKAINYLSKCAQMGYADAYYALGDIYYLGYRGDKDLAKARDCYVKGAFEGNAKCKYALARMEDNPQRANELYAEAYETLFEEAHNADEISQYLSSIYFQDGLGGVDINLNSSFYWAMESALAGYSIAQRKVGNHYFNGIATVEDKAVAEMWYQKADIDADYNETSYLDSVMTGRAKTAKPKKTATKKPTAKKAETKKPTTKKEPAKKSTTKKAPAKKPATKKPPAKKAPTKKTAPKKTVKKADSVEQQIEQVNRLIQEVDSLIEKQDVITAATDTAPEVIPTEAPRQKSRPGQLLPAPPVPPVPPIPPSNFYAGGTTVYNEYGRPVYVLRRGDNIVYTTTIYEGANRTKQPQEPKAEPVTPPVQEAPPVAVAPTQPEAQPVIANPTVKKPKAKKSVKKAPTKKTSAKPISKPTAKKPTVKKPVVKKEETKVVKKIPAKVSQPKITFDITDDAIKARQEEAIAKVVGQSKPIDDNKLPTSVAQLLMLAETGDVDAQYRLALQFETGDMVPQDTAEALRWYARAADADHFKAQNNLGIYFEKGIAVDKDVNVAARLYKLSAVAGYAPALYNLGVCYIEKIGVKRSFFEAARYLTESSNRNYGPAQYSLALLYENGKGVKRDIAKALQLYKYALINGIETARQKINTCTALLEESE